MTNNKTSASTKFYMKQANEIVDVLSEIIPTIYYDVFKDHFDIFMDKLWVKPDEKNPPILDRLMLPPGANVRTLEQTNWNTLPEDKKREWLKRMDLQALLKALAFRPKSLNLFCEKNSLKKEKMESVLHPMINWRNYGVGHKSVYKYEQMSEKDFKQIILEPVWDFTDLLSRHYAKECEIIRKKLHIIEMRMKLPDTNVQRLVELSGKPESTVREVLSILKIEVAQDGIIIGEDEKELADSIKRLSKKESVQQKQKEEGPEEKTNRWLELFNKYKKIIIPVAGVIVLLIIILLLTQCGKKSDKNIKNNIEKSVKETTIDNRKQVNPFKEGELNVKEEEMQEYSDVKYIDEEVPVNITIENKTHPDISYDVVDYYDDWTDYENHKDDVKKLVDNGESSSKKADKQDYEGLSYSEDGEIQTLFENRMKNQVLIIVVSKSTIENKKDINYVDSKTGEKYYAYVVKGIDLIRTRDELGKVNKKSLKKTIKQAKDDIASDEDENQSVTSKKYVGYYAALPKSNEKDESAYLYLIFKVNVRGENPEFWGDDNIKAGSYYYASVISNPRFNNEENEIYSIVYDNMDNYEGKMFYGECMNTTVTGLNNYNYFKKLKALENDDDGPNELRSTHDIVKRIKG